MAVCGRGGCSMMSRERASRAPALAPAGRVIDGTQGLLARLRRVPLRLIVGLARAGLRESLSNDARRAALLAGASTGVVALIRRWSRRRNRP